MPPRPRLYAPHPSGPPPQVPVVTVDVPDAAGGPTHPVTVPGRTPEEGFRYLYAVGGGLTGEAARDIYLGTVLQPVRDAYKRTLQGVESEIIHRRAALGANPSEGALRELAVWAARQRANTARLWRIPTGPAQLLSLEARDWQKYGAGGRTFENLMRRQAAEHGLSGSAAYSRILGTAVQDNAKVTASVSRGARFLRRGGAVLGVAGLAVSAYNIAEAPPELRTKVAEREGIDFVGGLVASEAAVGLLGVGAALLACTPPGWLIIGVGLAAGIAGSYLADRAFFPEDYKPVAGRMAAGVAVDPRHRYAMNDLAAHGLGGDVAAVTGQRGDAVRLTIGPTDTEDSIAAHALRAAAQSAGLDRAGQDGFVRRFANGADVQPGGRTWVGTGPGFPPNGAPVQPGDFIRLRGQVIDWPLTDEQLSTLDREAEAAAARPR